MADFFMSRFTAQSHALLRIVTGFLFLWHGLQKLFSVPSPPPPEAPAFVIWVAGPIELVGGALVAIGLFTRPAAFLCSGLMASAYFMAHQPQGLLPIQNQGELAALYCWVFLFLSAHGAGIWSVDAARRSGS
jgi:putative oxidoreductase